VAAFCRGSDDAASGATDGDTTTTEGSSDAPVDSTDATPATNPDKPEVEIPSDIPTELQITVLEEERDIQEKHRFDMLAQSQGTVEKEVKEEMNRVKAQRRAEAEERSRQRQQDKDYFALKRIANDEGHVRATQPPILDAEPSDAPDEEEVQPERVTNASTDPFAPKFRPKFGGRFA